jgi:azurin
MDAVVPVQGTDYTTSGNGVLTVSMDRTSGQAVRLTLLATSGSVSVLSLQLRAKTISVQRTVKVQRDDPQSIALHGEKDYPDQAPWANANDADAIAGMILLHYARRRPIVQLRIVSADPSHWVQAITRTVSDRIHIRYDEMGIDDDFFVEKITHTLRRYNQPGLPPVHEVVLGCERDLQGVVNPFTFDKRGAGFDQGVFDYIQTDKTSSVFIFDHPTQGQFDVGLYGT